jgi:hypothetical protein
MKTPRKKPAPTVDDVIDEGSKESFPASDPVSAAQPGDSDSGRHDTETRPVPPAPRRSPDWLLEKK